MLTQEYLKSQVLYEPETGKFFWLVRKSGRQLDKPIQYGVSYGSLTLEGTRYALHRLAWFYMNGEWPPEMVDHIDGNSTNNKWSNLRLATYAENAQNRRRRRVSITGVKGVSKHYASNTWHVTVDKDGKRHSLGPFYSIGDAYKAHAKLSKELFGEYHRPDIPRKQKVQFSASELKQALEDFKRSD